jgi:hypothetical protein
MAAAKITLPVIEQGATYRHTLVWMQLDGTTPINLVGCTAKMQIRSVVTSSTVILELSTANSRLVIDGALGKISLYVPDEDTTALEAIKGAVYDLEVHFPDGTVTRLCEGKISISAEVTRNG